MCAALRSAPDSTRHAVPGATLRPAPGKVRPIPGGRGGEDAPHLGLLRRLPLFSKLSDASLQVLASTAHLQHLGRHALIMEQGGTSGVLFLLLSGRAVAYRTDERGREVILHYLAPGDHFGEMSLVDGLPHSASVQTTKSSVVLMLRESDFAHCLATDAGFCGEVMKGLTARLRRANASIGMLALMDVRGRVAQALIELSEEVDGQRCIRRKVSRSEMGKRVGATREMVSRLLGEMERHGLIATQANGWVTLNVQPPTCRQGPT